MTTLVVIHKQDEKIYNFQEGLQIPSETSTLYSLQVDDLEHHFATDPITKVVLINMNLRYDNVRDYLMEFGQPELVEITIDQVSHGLELFVPRYEETKYARTYYKAGPISIHSYLRNLEETDPAIEHCPSCGSPINSDGNDGSCH